jgi:hypothetical protein
MLRVATLETVTEAPRSARASYVLAAVSLFVPVLLVILLPTMPQVLFYVIASLAVVGSLVAIGLAIRTLRLGAAGRLSAVFGILLGLVALFFSAPLVVTATQQLSG